VPSSGEPREISDDEYVTQVGSVSRRGSNIWSTPRFSFRSAPRADVDKGAMSVILGRVPIEKAVPLVARRADAAGSGDAVRYALVSDLRKEGFSVEHTPSRTIPDHGSVRWEGEWDEQAFEAFDNCFGEYAIGPSS
jgi:hypothetical protein